MIRFFPILAMVLCLAAARAEPAADDLARGGVAEFRAAFQAWDATRFATAADHFRKAAAADPAKAVYPYWLGVAEFHRMLQLQSAGRAKDGDGARDAATTALEKAVALDPAHAESHALLGTLLGMKISGAFLGGMRFGPAVLRHQQAALDHGAANPRVHYLLGAARFHNAGKPAEFRAALDELQKAIKLFDQEAAKPAGPLEPRWGASSCLTFAGRAHEALGERKEAADSYRRALRLHPHDSVATAGLKRLETP
ncbi:MAG: tetratricopeptide repeat protein [Akkermansiaceae bacterium]|nr:tetratricopeptide repeat protein [Akkermansiaceae bacterium]